MILLSNWISAIFIFIYEECGQVPKPQAPVHVHVGTSLPRYGHTQRSPSPSPFKTSSLCISLSERSEKASTVVAYVTVHYSFLYSSNKHMTHESISKDKWPYLLTDSYTLLYSVNHFSQSEAKTASTAVAQRSVILSSILSTSLIHSPLKNLQTPTKE